MQCVLKTSGTICLHVQCIQAFGETSGDFPYPIIADPTRDLAVAFGMIDPDEQDAAGLPLTARAVCNPWLLLFLGFGRNLTVERDCFFVLL